MDLGCKVRRQRDPAAEQVLAAGGIEERLDEPAPAKPVAGNVDPFEDVQRLPSGGWIDDRRGQACRRLDAKPAEARFDDAARALAADGGIPVDNEVADRALQRACAARM